MFSLSSYVTLRAEMDLPLVFSACPQDLAATNGPDIIPAVVDVEIGVSEIMGP